MTDLIRTISLAQAYDKKTETLLDREWLVTNGLGGYASGSLGGVPTRRYHGWLIAGLADPLGRTMMLNHLAESVMVPSGKRVRLGGEERDRHDIELHGLEYFEDFHLETGLPVWRTRVDKWVFERRLVMPHMQNTSYIMYRLLEGDGPVKLRVRPSLQFRGHDAFVSVGLQAPYTVTYRGQACEIRAPDERLPPLRMRTETQHGSLTLDGGSQRTIFYRVEADRGYDARGAVWSPGYFTLELHRGMTASLVASTDEWPTIDAMQAEHALELELDRRKQLTVMAHESARTGIGAELVLAADQFIFTPRGRSEAAARSRAGGDEMCSVIAGYHWFTDWGRDTMISLVGLTLATGRFSEARWILKMFSNAVRDGLIPNMYPEGKQGGLYHTADASLWFFHGVKRYVDATGDQGTLSYILPKLIDIADRHISGTRFGIGVDPSDGLIREGEQGYQLTWMDAKVDDWVVTPRRGKPVEINALWYNALMLLEGWVRAAGDTAKADTYAAHAAKARASFNARFWNPHRNFLFDVVDAERGGNEDLLRPNQMFAISLDHPVLDEQYWEPVLLVIREKLLTPVGLRSLAPGEPDYKSSYFGDLRARDAAYHQGTVWAYLIGHFIDAWLKLYPDDKATARVMLAGFDAHLSEGCVGSISEVFDAEAPFNQRGCIAQAWSVAEVLRAWIKTS
ncbi:MAG: glycogen debranching enzyme family protein [Clostridia bacterium]|nr:glycogen debranching enzyme family protein [Deltaproteobacteria bacterium]